uniref:Uncharacterized protein n=1 Tax=Toxoplasma gondii TgCATBr9 TaxID=943120 RepID=A0A2T6ID69_TOXGO|nr:hypothetical protein TGBR9_385450 [Toxoplasma gondii TgCATBr9]
MQSDSFPCFSHEKVASRGLVPGKPDARLLPGGKKGRRRHADFFLEADSNHEGRALHPLKFPLHTDELGGHPRKRREIHDVVHKSRDCEEQPPTCQNCTKTKCVHLCI